MNPNLQSTRRVINVAVCTDVKNVVNKTYKLLTGLLSVDGRPSIAVSRLIFPRSKSNSNDGLCLLLRGR